MVSEESPNHMKVIRNGPNAFFVIHKPMNCLQATACAADLFKTSTWIQFAGGWLAGWILMVFLQPVTTLWNNLLPLSEPFARFQGWLAGWLALNGFSWILCHKDSRTWEDATKGPAALIEMFLSIPGLAGRLTGWLAGCLAGRLVGRMAAWLVEWLEVQLVMCRLDGVQMFLSHPPFLQTSYHPTVGFIGIYIHYIPFKYFI